MKPTILAEIDRIAGDRLTPDMREEIADRVIKIMEEFNRKIALVAIEAVKTNIVQISNDSAATEPTK